MTHTGYLAENRINYTQLISRQYIKQSALKQPKGKYINVKSKNKVNEQKEDENKN